MESQSPGTRASVAKRITLFKIPLPVLLLTLVSFSSLYSTVGAYLDVAYHTAPRVDTFFQPAHLVIYSGISITLILSVFATLYFLLLSSSASEPEQRRYVALPIISGLQLVAGYGDLVWHSIFGFDSFLSPIHITITIAAILQSCLIFWYIRKNCSYYCCRHNNNNSNSSDRHTSLSSISLVISIANVWLSVTFLLLMLSVPPPIQSVKSIGIGSATTANALSGYNYYAVPPRMLSLIVVAMAMPILSLGIMMMAKAARISSVYVAIVFASVIGASTIVNHCYLLFILPLLLIGTLGPAVIFDTAQKINYNRKKEDDNNGNGKSGKIEFVNLGRSNIGRANILLVPTLLFGAFSLLIYMPYSPYAAAYAFRGEITSGSHWIIYNLLLSTSNAPYYGILVFAGMVSNFIFHHFLIFCRNIIKNSNKRAIIDNNNDDGNNSGRVIK